MKNSLFGFMDAGTETRLLIYSLGEEMIPDFAGFTPIAKKPAGTIEMQCGCNVIHF